MAKVQFTLSDRDRKFILDNVPDLSPSVRGNLTFARPDEDLLTFELHEESFEGLMEDLSSVACGTKSGLVKNNLKRIWSELDQQVPMDLEGCAPPPAQSPSAAVLEEIQRTLRENPVASLEEANQVAQKISDRYNRTPQAQLDGLSPIQMMRLMHADWESPESGLVFNTEVSLEELSDAEILVNARILLQALQDQNGTKMTSGGNLNRKFVLEMAEQFQFLDDFLNSLRDWKKTWDEEDVAPLFVLRHVLQAAGLIRKYKGKFRITKKGEMHLREKNAGKLMLLLFRAFFQKFNLAYLDGVGSVPEQQYTITFSFFTIWRVADKWIALDDLAEGIFLPAVATCFQDARYYSDNPLRLPAETRVLRPLERFGLVECENTEEERIFRHSLLRVRKTALFDRWIEFRLDEFEAMPQP